MILEKFNLSFYDFRVAIIWIHQVKGMTTQMKYVIAELIIGNRVVLKYSRLKLILNISSLSGSNERLNIVIIIF